MNDSGQSDNESDLLSELRASYHSTWASGSRPDLKQFLEQVPLEKRLDAGRILIPIDIYYLSQSEETVTFSNYVGLLPEHEEAIRELVDREIQSPSWETVNSSNDSDTAATYVPPSTPATSSGSVPDGESPGSLGDHELLEEIARGGMGVVFKARHKTLKRIVAVKLILSGQFASQEEVQRFYAEAEAAARLEHPNIVPIYECAEENDRHYFSMGFVDGSSLSQVIREHPFAPRKAAELMLEIAQAVEYAHAQGIIHRDLKPANILIDSNDRPRITDFGLAKSVQTDSGMTATGQILGTPSYMPPEQAMGLIENVNETSDVYSLGAILYEMLIGRSPFRAANMMETLKQVIERPPTPPRQIDPSLDKDLETICLKCLEKEQHNRYGSASELVAELQRYLNGESILARPVGPAMKVYRWCRRKPLLVAFSVSMILLSVIGFYSVRLWRESTATRQLVALQEVVRTSLEDLELTPDSYEQSADAIADLRRQDREAAALAEEKMNARFSNMLRSELGKPRLSSQEMERLEKLLEFWSRQQTDQAQEFQEMLASRRSQWIHLADWDTSSTQAETLFAPVDVSISESGSITHRTNIEYLSEETLTNQSSRVFRAPLLRTSLSTRGDLRFELTFEPNWNQTHEIGVLAETSEKSGYEFLLRTDGSRVRVAQSENQFRMLTFDESFTSGGTGFLEIRRNGSPLARAQVSLSRLKNQPLSLRGTWEGSNLLFQCNSLPPLEFFDPFPLNANGTTNLLLRLSAGVELSAISVEEKQRKLVSEFEVADQAFQNQDYVTAEKLYRDQAETLGDANFQQEALYKRAICLTEMNRLPDARQILSKLLTSEGDRWPTFAGLQLWLLNVRQNNTAEADAVYTYLSGRYSFGELASLMPVDMREEVLHKYRQEIENTNNFYQYRPDRLAVLNRIAEIDRYLSLDGRGTTQVQLDLMRGYLFAGEYHRALNGLTQLAERTQAVGVLIRLARLLRYLDRSEEALEVLDKGIAYWREAAPEKDLIGLSIARARTLYALGRDAETWLQLQEILDDRNVSPHDYANIMLFVGYLYRANGDEANAKKAWAEGFEETKSLLVQKQFAGKTNTSPIISIMMGTLSETVTDQEIDAFRNLLLASRSSQSMSSFVKLIDSDSIDRSLKEMWLSSYGSEVVKHFALESTIIRERAREPMLAAALSFTGLRGFGRPLSRRELPVLQTLFEQLLVAYLDENTLQTPQVMQLGLTWKGTTNFLGWQSVQKTLAPELRDQLAYLFGHRMLVINQPAKAKPFFESARDQNHSPRLAKLAEEALLMLEQQTGQIRLTAPDEIQFIREILNSGEVVKTVSWPSNRLCYLEPGKYQLRIQGAPADLRLSRYELQIESTHRSDLSMIDLSAPSEESSSIPGLLTHPVDVPNLPDWNVFFRSPQSAGPVKFSPDGTKIAHADEKGNIRIFDARSGELLHLLTGHRDKLHLLDWNHDGTILASGGDDRKFHVWRDGVSIYSQDMQSPVFSGQFVSNSDRVLLTQTYQKVIYEFDMKTMTMSQLTDTGYRYNGLSVSADGKFLAAKSEEHKVVLFELPSGRVLDELDHGQPIINALSFHPTQNRLLVTSTDEKKQRLATYWNPLSREAELSVVFPGSQPLYYLAWAATGKSLAIGMTAGHVAIVDPETLQISKQVQVRSRRSRWALSPEGRILASPNLTLYSIPENETPLTLQETFPESHILNSASWNPTSGELFLSRPNGEVAVISPSGEYSQTLERPHPSTEYCDVSLSPDGDKLVLLQGHRVQFWRRTDSRWQPLQQTHLSLKSRAVAGHWSRDGSRFAVHTWPDKVSLFQPPWTEPTVVEIQQEKRCHWLSWSADSGSFLTFTLDQNLGTLYDRDGKRLRQISVGDKEALKTGTLALHRPQSWWGIDYHGKTFLFDKNGKVSRSWNSNSLGSGEHIAMSPDGDRIAGVFWKGKALVWDLDGNLLHALDDRLDIKTVQFHENGNQILVMSNSGDAFIYDLERERALEVYVDAGGRLLRLTMSGQIEVIKGSPTDAEEFVYTVRNPQGGLDLLTQQQWEQRIESALSREF